MLVEDIKRIGISYTGGDTMDLRFVPESACSINPELDKNAVLVSMSVKKCKDLAKQILHSLGERESTHI